MKKSSPAPSVSLTVRFKNTLCPWWPNAGLGIPLALLAWQAYFLRFTQDDTYIFFRYARNLLNGHGLVFNSGERVEGYTSLSWTLLTALGMRLGVDPVIFTKVLGMASAAGVLLLLFYLGRLLAPQRHKVFSLIAPLLLSVNGAFCLWSVSGMETAFFNLLIVAGMLAYLREEQAGRMSYSCPALFALAALTRPEGIWVFGLTLAHRLYRMLRGSTFSIKKTVVWCAVFAVPVLLLFLWRLYYYRQLFPNSFYAKTGLAPIYLQMGWDYTVYFFRFYGGWGALLAVPLAGLWLKRRDTGWLPYLTMLLAAWCAYIILVGGDVLPEHRFFLPVAVLMYLLAQEFLYKVFVFAAGQNLPMRRLTAGLLLGVAALAAWTWWYPVKNIYRASQTMQGVVDKYIKLAGWLNGHRTLFGNFSLATAGVGAISYHTHAVVIDMLGLTDRHIARHPQKIPGLTSPVREQNFNVDYVLARRPDFIYFITNRRPVALAEKALFASGWFRRHYRIYAIDEVKSLYKYQEPPAAMAGLDSAYGSIRFIEEYAQGLKAGWGQPDAALEHFQQAIQLGPPDFALPYEEIGLLMVNALPHRDQQDALPYFQKALAIDDRCARAHAYMGYFALLQGDTALAAREVARSIELSPFDGFPHFIQGKLLSMSGRYEMAVLEFETAWGLTVDDDHKRLILFETGLAHRERRDSALARRCFTDFLNMSAPDAPLRPQAEALLKTLPPEQ